MSSSIITSDDLRLEKSPLTLSPYQKFMYALNSKESKRQYPKRLQRFLDFVNISSSSIEDNCNLLYEKLEQKEDNTSWLENELFKFFSLQNHRVESAPDQLISPSYYLYCNTSHLPHGFEALRARYLF